MAPQITLLPGVGDIFSDITSGLGDITSKVGGVFDPPPQSSTSLSVSTNLSSLPLPSSSIPIASSSSSEVVSSSTTPTPTPTPSSTESVPLSTVTDFLTSTAELPLQTSNNGKPAPKGFLENKALSGFVFALVGLVGLAVILSAVMYVVRRRRRKRLLQEAVSFEPTSSRMYLDEMDQDDRQWNEKMDRGGSSEGGQGYGHYPPYQMSPPAPTLPHPPPPAAMYFEATPPSQLAYGGVPNYAAVSVGQDAYDGMTGTSEYTRTSESSVGQRREMAPPALPDTFGEDGHRAVTPEPIGPPVPLKITNQ